MMTTYSKIKQSEVEQAWYDIVLDKNEINKKFYENILAFTEQVD